MDHVDAYIACNYELSLVLLLVGYDQHSQKHTLLKRDFDIEMKFSVLESSTKPLGKPETNSTIFVTLSEVLYIAGIQITH